VLSSYIYTAKKKITKILFSKKNCNNVENLKNVNLILKKSEPRINRHLLKNIVYNNLLNIGLK